MMMTPLLLIAMVGFQSCFSPAMSSSPYSRSVNNLGFQICNLLEPHDNFFLSPISIHMILEMVYNGSAGNTKEQLKTAFNASDHSLSEPNLYRNTAYLAKLYSGKNPDYDLVLANAAFVDKGFALQDDFVKNIKAVFNARMDKIAFADSTIAKNIINNWAVEKTHGMIPNFLEEPFNPATVLVLLNAMYFKGAWKTPFNPEHTYEGTFKKSNNGTSQVKLMKITDPYLFYLEDQETKYKFLEVPYKGGYISMLLALPMDENALPDLTMTDEILYRVTRNVSETSLTKVVIPKFSLRYKTQLKKVLKEMGVQDLFTGNADLSPMSTTGGLSVNDVLHEALINVDEKGSEAAAVSAVDMVGSSLNQPEFVADRPFLFYILDNRFDVVLFAGRLVDPQ